MTITKPRQKAAEYYIIFTTQQHSRIAKLNMAQFTINIIFSRPIPLDWVGKLIHFSSNTNIWIISCPNARIDALVTKDSLGTKQLYPIPSVLLSTTLQN